MSIPNDGAMELEEGDSAFDLEEREYAEVAEYSVPRPSWLVMQTSPPYANTTSLLAGFVGEHPYENTSFF